MNKARNRTQGLHPGFTLIELLVVVTIIVILLAMLTPALDKAIYQAELVKCGANLHVTGSALLTYALHNNRNYPPRVVASWGDLPTTLSIKSSAFVLDERPPLNGYISITRTLNDPLTAAVNLETANPDTYVHGTYARWYS